MLIMVSQDMNSVKINTGYIFYKKTIDNKQAYICLFIVYSFVITNKLEPIYFFLF